MAFPTVSCFPAPLPVLLQLCFFLLLQKRNRGNKNVFAKPLSLTIVLCLLMGFGCMCFSYCSHRTFGVLLFQSVEAASQLRSLSFVCPFLYLSGMLSSILHGLGKTGIAFACSISVSCHSAFLRIIPHSNDWISWIFFGILCSQICLDFLFNPCLTP